MISCDEAVKAVFLIVPLNARLVDPVSAFAQVADAGVDV